MEINGKHHYVYGKFYDSNMEKSPSKASEYDVVVYRDVQNVSRVISSLEGHFVSESALDLDGNKNVITLRTQMGEFEKLNNGKFIPFDKK